MVRKCTLTPCTYPQTFIPPSVSSRTTSLSSELPVPGFNRSLISSLWIYRTKRWDQRPIIYFFFRFLESYFVCYLILCVMCLWTPLRFYCNSTLVTIKMRSEVSSKGEPLEAHLYVYFLVLNLNLNEVMGSKSMFSDWTIWTTCLWSCLPVKMVNRLRDLSKLRRFQMTGALLTSTKMKYLNISH